MKKTYLFLAAFILFSGYQSVYAQLIGTSCYLQGKWLEIGICPNGALGANTPPAGYHQHACCGSGAPTPGAQLAEVYDYGHDGWAVGAPPFMGDYTYPGSPFEGWELQANGQRLQAYQSLGGFTSVTGGTTWTGGVMSAYTNSGGVLTGSQTGTFSPAGGGTLQVKQETRVDTLASWVVFTTRMYNTGATALPGVYYFRSCDPDNDETWGGYVGGGWTGGGFTTDNTVTWQNDVDHRVGVTALGQGAPLHAPMTLCTKDCRAVACTYFWWGLPITNDLNSMWTMSTSFGGTTAYYTVGVNVTGDYAIGLVFNVGTIAAGDSAVVSCAYVFNNSNGIDSAFREPSCRIAGGPLAQPPVPYPGIVRDTYNACANPGLTLVPVDLVFAEDKAWTWSKWTWVPGTGLSATTGAHVIVNTVALPPTMTYTVTGVDPATCQTRTMYITFTTCNNVRSNSPCEGDTLFLKRVGDSTGCTYYWYGPGGYTSTLQDPFIYPATMIDSGKFYVVRTLLGISDTDSISVTVHIKPTITATNNSPLCLGIVDTLLLYSNPGMSGMTYQWSGPSGFSSTLQNPSRPGFVPPFVGTYTVIARTAFGCKDTATTYADTITQPRPPIITGPNYCQGQPFVPWTITGLSPGGYVLWYPTATGGTGTTTAPTVPTSIPGIYKYYFSQRSGSCESIRDSITIRVTATPPAPLVVGNTNYCQYIGPFIPLTVMTTPTGTARWYTAPTGGTFTLSEPIPNLSIPGNYTWYVSQVDTGCESPRTPVTIHVHPKPAPPGHLSHWYCQYNSPNDTIQFFKDGLDPPEVVKYYGPGITAGTTTVPTPNSSFAPDTIVYWATETTVWGCVSDSSSDTIIIRVKPDAPQTKNTRYCQGAQAAPLNALVDSVWNSTNLSWYQGGTLLSPTPVPPTSVTPGIYTWYVSQWVNECQSDSSAVKVEIVYQPDFKIEASNLWVCQHDSLRLAYKGAPLSEVLYAWTLPQGATVVDGTNLADSMIIVKFDSALQNNYIRLRAANDSGFCFDTAGIRISVVPEPWMSSYTKHDVCLHDTVQLILNSRSLNAYDYQWYVNLDPLFSSPAVNVVTANSNSGGPFKISWVDTGRYVITVVSTTKEGCKSQPSLDSVEVHGVPDASFAVIATSNGNTLCLDDSVEFAAVNPNYNNTYEWMPSDYFNNDNKPVIWGRLREQNTTITLKVTDPYGCYATKDMPMTPATCCTILFPNAFTPNGSGPVENNVFKPYYTGYHRFHLFRIVNRWGTTVFESANTSDTRWDGTYNGVPQDMGVYYWYIKYDCGGKTMEAKGDVTLIR